LVDFEQLKIPVAVRPLRAKLRRNPSAARSKASSQVAGRRVGGQAAGGEARPGVLAGLHS
jgi:hypothetical protein